MFYQISLVLIMNAVVSFKSQVYRTGLYRQAVAKLHLTGTPPKPLDTAFVHKRFWTENRKHNSRELVDIRSAIAVVETILRDSQLEPSTNRLSTFSTGNTEQGLVIIPKFEYMIPIHGGVLQIQHGTELPLKTFNTESTETTSSSESDTTDLVFCGFSTRAELVKFMEDDGSRAVNVDRMQAMDEAIENEGLGISGQELLTPEYAGTTPAKIYRSFVCPRARSENHCLMAGADGMAREAKQKAKQINMALRQLRADRAIYLRNVDKPKTSSAFNVATATSQEGCTESSTSVSTPLIHPVVFVLDNVRSASNVGSIFRTAETAGAAEVITCGITAHPPHPKLLKTAMQSVEVVPTRHFEDSMVAIQTLKSEGYTIAAMETTSISLKYTDVQFTGKIALVLGHELTGVDTRIMEMADMVVEIPTYGFKNSLNVASAASIVLYEILRQWHINDTKE